MKNKDLLGAMNDIKDDYVLEAAVEMKKKRVGKYRRVLVYAAAAACVCLAAGAGIWAAFSGSGQGGKKDSAYAGYAIAQAEYPKCVPYPDEELLDASEKGNYGKLWDEWREERKKHLDMSQPFQESLHSFYAATMKQMLVSEKNVNRVYSPLNLYMALAMLAEMAEGDSRAQILELLNEKEIEGLREKVPAFWTANYSDNGKVTSILANSLWLDQDISVVPETMDRLADLYHASSFRGEMGSEEFTQALQAWLDAQTGGLLKEQAKEQKLDASTVLALASTIYYRAQWAEPFLESETAAGIFHAANGDISCDFMCRREVRAYYSGEGFSAVCLKLHESGNMWMFLPEKGVSINQLMDREEVLNLICGNGSPESRKSAMVNMEVPKFDICSDINLIPSLKEMGITDVFDSFLADFSPALGEKRGVCVEEAKHAARVAVDEKGLTAAAFTLIGMDESAALAEEEVDFILDRPFLFAVTGADGAMLFAGVVEQPQE